MNTAFQKGPSIESLTGCPLTFQFNKVGAKTQFLKI
jgi:hypothetical protein